MLLKESCVDETPREDKIMEGRFEDIKNNILVELVIYTRNHMVEVSRRKVPFNDWVGKVLKMSHQLYQMPIPCWGY